MMTLIHIILSILGTLSLATERVDTATAVDIYWNKTNSIFSNSNNNHIVEVRIKETIKFVCPYYDTSDPQAEHYIIYRLPKQYYDNCSLPTDVDDAQLRSYGIEQIHNCSSPYNKSAFILFIDSFVPLPGSYGGLVYEYGQEYYFTSISTGTSSGIHNRRPNYSACKNYNMKAIVRVCCNENATFSCPSGVIKCDGTAFTNPPLVSRDNLDAVTQDPTASTPTTRPPTPSSIQPAVSWSTLKSVISSQKPTLKTTNVEATHTDPVVGNSSTLGTASSLFTVVISLIFSRLSLELT